MGTAVAFVPSMSGRAATDLLTALCRDHDSRSLLQCTSALRAQARVTDVSSPLKAASEFILPNLTFKTVRMETYLRALQRVALAR